MWKLLAPGTVIEPAAVEPMETLYRASDTRRIWKRYVPRASPSPTTLSVYEPPVSSNGPWEASERVRC